MQTSKSIRRSITSISIGILCSLALCGCKSLDQRNIDNDFPGLQAAIDKQITCVLFVHGMGGYSNTNPVDPGTITQAILKMPNIQQTAPEHPVDFADSGTLGTLTRQDFIDTSTQHELRAYKLTWEPVTAALKEQYLGYDQSAENASRRQSLDNDIRKSVLDSSVPDVVLYVGPYKSAIQRTVKQALRKIDSDLETREDKQKDYHYVFVTWSLGSKIVFDCLADPRITADESTTKSSAAPADDVTFTRIAEKTYSVYMLANQIPLLTLGDVKPSSRTNHVPQKAVPYEALLSVAHRRKQATSRPVATTQPASGRLFIVAFSDPNDLLSYPIPPWLESSNEAHFANVSITVAKTAYYIPTEGWIANPIPAHTGYGIDDQIIHLLLFGGNADKAK
jgi:hypothetical protein